jgi:long-subunit acyl-CoA synthetase (AMP-forming)
MMNAVIEGVHLSWKGGKDNQGDKTIAFLPFFHIYVRHISPTSSHLTTNSGF